MVKMQKIVKRMGNSLGIIFNRDERKIIGLKKGDILEVDVEKRGKKLGCQVSVTQERF